MSLQVWMPLNGSLENKGLTDVTITNNNATVDSSGKIGQCYSFNGSNAKIVNTLSSAVTSSVGTLCCWVKMNSLPGSSSFYNLLQLGSLGGYATCRLGIYIEYSNYINISIDGGGTGSNRYTHSLVANRWYHICATNNGTTVKLYIDGEEVLSKSSNKSSYTTAAPYLYVGGTSSYFLNGYMNDVRYYDNALSEKEIKEIAKGLVLHLPLNNNGLGNENLLPNTNEGTTGWIWTMQVGDYTKVEETTLSGVRGCKFTRGTTAQSGWSVIYYSLINENVFKASTNYTLSVDIYPSVNTYLNVSIREANGTNVICDNAGSQAISANKWNHMIFYLTSVATLPSSTNETIYFTGISPAVGNSYIFRNLKLEEGSIATPWSPNLTDENYPDYGPGIPQNLLSGTPKTTASTAYLFTALNLLENLQAGKTYTLQLWNVNVSHSAKTVGQTGISVYWGGGNIVLFGWYGSTYFTNGHADYLSKTFTVTESHARGNGSANKWLNLYNSVPSASGTLSASVEKWKLEESSTASDYTPARTDVSYKEEGYNNRTIFDQSGYCHNGASNNKIIYSSDSPKYNVSMFFNGTNRIFASALPTETKTISIWAKTTKNKNTAQCICGDSASALCLFIYGGGLVTYFRGSTGGEGSRVTFGNEYKENDWNHFVVVKTGDTTRDVYCNGVLLTPAANNYYTHATGFWIGQRNATGALPFYGYLSDFRAYATALSEKDVKSLYNNNAYIDSDGKIYGKIR